jgi:hypothetical protein
MRVGFALAAPLLLAACEGREAVSICAAVGELAGEVTAAYHDADGLQAVLISDAVTGQAIGLQSVLEESFLPALWRIAETTMRSLPDSEPTPCGFDRLSTVTVTFSDGSVLTKQTTCTGNALSRVASEVLEVSSIAAVRETGVVDERGPVTTILDACERMP